MRPSPDAVLGVRPGPHGNVRSERTSPWAPSTGRLPRAGPGESGARTSWERVPWAGAGVNSRAFCCRLHPNPFSSARGAERRAALAAELARAEDHTGLEQVCRAGWANALEPCGRGSGVPVPTPHPHPALEPDTRGERQQDRSPAGDLALCLRPPGQEPGVFARFGRLLPSGRGGYSLCGPRGKRGRGPENPRTRRQLLSQSGIPRS